METVKNGRPMEDEVAEVCHEANRAYCRIIGDTSQPHWAEAPQWQKDSAVKGVQYRLANPSATPEAMHQSWLDQKIQDGWKLGPVKDADKKEHPCMLPYGELPLDQRRKDALFSAVFDALMTH